MTPQSIQSLSPQAVRLARTAVAILAAGLCVLVVFGSVPQANALAGGPTPTLPGRIYCSASWNLSNDGVKIGVLSFDPNTGRQRAEPVSSNYEVVSFDRNTGSQRTDLVSSHALLLRIAPLTKTAAYEVSLLRWQQVVIARLDGAAKEVRILRTPGVAGIAWAPDGVRLVVTTWVHKQVGRERGLPRTETWLVKSDGSARARLPIPDTHVVLDWSRDGRFFLTSLPLRTQPRAKISGFPMVLYTMGIDGTCVTRMTADEENAHYGRISPDSKTIAYITSGGERFPNLRYGVSIVRTNGDGRREIMHHNAAVPVDMCWCPDGKHLAVQIREWQKNAFGHISSAGSHLEIFDLFGNRLRTIAPKDVKFFEDASLDWQ